MRFYYPIIIGLLVACFSAFLCARSAFANESIEVDKSDTSSPSEGLVNRSDPPGAFVKDAKQLKGWEHAFSGLVRHGSDPVLLAKIFSDSRMPRRTPLYFSVEPKESTYLYRKHNTSQARQSAMGFYKLHSRYFRQAHYRFGVPAGVILAILQIETNCGSYTGKSRVFHRLVRLGSAASPDNIERNSKKRSVRQKNIPREQIVLRAKKLENTFLPHAAAVLRIAENMNIHPLELRGSISGAIGIPQFLPGNLDHYGIDGNNDGKIDLFSAPDAVLSVANFLSENGWSSQYMKAEDAKKAIWHYNHSQPYVSTVLSMAGQLERDIVAFEKQRIREISVLTNHLAVYPAGSFKLLDQFAE